jgi:hypothetical protein
MILTEEKQRNQGTMCPSAILSTTHPTWTDLGMNLDHCSETPQTNCLSYGTDYIYALLNTTYS